MVSKLTKKAILSIKKNIEMYGGEMAKLQEKIAVIDEKYRKMAEEAKKDLATEYANLEAEQEIWQSSLSRYGEDVVNEVLSEKNASSTDDDETSTETQEVTETKTVEEEVVETATEPIEEEVVVDTIFPENNEEPKVESTTSVEANQLNEIWPEEKEEGKKEEVFVPDAPMTEEEAEQKEKDQWPEFPEEW